MFDSSARIICPSWTAKLQSFEFTSVVKNVTAGASPQRRPVRLQRRQRSRCCCRAPQGPRCRERALRAVGSGSCGGSKPQSRPACRLTSSRNPPAAALLPAAAAGAKMGLLAIAKRPKVALPMRSCRAPFMRRLRRCRSPRSGFPAAGNCVTRCDVRRVAANPLGAVSQRAFLGTAECDALLSTFCMHLHPEVAVVLVLLFDVCRACSLTLATFFHLPRSWRF